MTNSKHVAQYWRPLSNQWVQCELCPHYCMISNGSTGKCRTRKNESGVLYSLNYGQVISYAYDPIEKKPLKNFQPGKSIFSIGTYGCNLTCQFCQNHELVQMQGLYPEFEDSEILEMATRNGSIGIAYTYNEPIVWYEYVKHISERASALGLVNVMVTNGYINEEPMRALLPYIDAMNIDLKAMTNAFYGEICGGSLEPVLKTIALCAEHTHVEITNLMIDSLNSDFETFKVLVDFIASVDVNIPLHISRYFPNHLLTLPPTEIETLKIARDVARKKLKHVYVGNAYIP